MGGKAGQLPLRALAQSVAAISMRTVPRTSLGCCAFFSSESDLTAIIDGVMAGCLHVKTNVPPPGTAIPELRSGNAPRRCRQDTSRT